ncbi:MAG: DUF4468 domain-containing protein [Bacteroidales bacterium]|nr:DUF4468 domain-containing protein [Bacteroidales bacterium]
MRKLFLLLFMAVSGVAYAQLNSGDMGRYLAKDAVPVIDGHVVFTNNVAILDGNTQEKIGEMARKWLDTYLAGFDVAKNRVISSAPGEIVAMGDRELVFTDNAIAYDAAQMSYVLTIRYTVSESSVEISRVKYVYNDGTGTRRITAEEYIVDEFAVNKKGTKLTPITGKFRKKTLDFVDEVFGSFNETFKYYTKAGLAEIVKNAPQVMQAQQPVQQAVQQSVQQAQPEKPAEVQKPVQPAQPEKPVQPVQPEKPAVPVKAAEPVKAAQPVQPLVEAAKALQGCFTRIMEGADTYMIMIYPGKDGKPSGEASMIIECRKLPSSNMGEIVNVWAK